MLHLEAHCLNALYVLHSDLLAVRCWTGSVWTVQSSCLNDLAALCTIIHLTGGSQCPAEGVNLSWPLAVHSDKGTSMEYVRDAQCMHIDAYGCILIWTSLFYREKETLLRLCWKFLFKMICLFSRGDADILRQMLSYSVPHLSCLLINQHMSDNCLFSLQTLLLIWKVEQQASRKNSLFFPAQNFFSFSLTAVYFECFTP